MEGSDVGFPYKGAKEHYILDLENDISREVVAKLVEVTPVPKKKKK